MLAEFKKYRKKRRIVSFFLFILLFSISNSIIVTLTQLLNMHGSSFMAIVIVALALYMSYILLRKIYPTNYLKWLEKNVTINTPDLNEILSLYFSGNYITQENLAGLEIDENFKKYIQDHFINDPNIKELIANVNKDGFNDPIELKSNLTKFLFLTSFNSLCSILIGVIIFFITDIVIKGEVTVVDIVYISIIILLFSGLFFIILKLKRKASILINENEICYHNKIYSYAEIVLDDIKKYTHISYINDYNIDFELSLKDKSEKLKVKVNNSYKSIYTIANTLIYFSNSWKEKQSQNSNN